MLLCVGPVVECVDEIAQRPWQDSDRPKPADDLSDLASESCEETTAHVVLLTPRGRRLDQPLVEELANHQRLVLLCGRYEGFDQRVVDILNPDEVSVGDFVLNGGEVAAMVMIDSIVRLVPGVLGHERSAEEDSFSGPNRVLEFPQYTRPREYRGHAVPEVLLSGDHERIAEWRKQQSYHTTKTRREDLLRDQDGVKK